LLRAKRNVTITLAVGLALIAMVTAVVLTRAPPRVVGVNGPAATVRLGVTTADSTICQADETLPRGVSAIRLAVVAFFGANVHVTAYDGSRVLTEGGRGPDWTGASVTVPVNVVSRAVSGVTLCLALGPNSEPLIVTGNATPAQDAALVLRGRTPTPAIRANAAEALKGRISVEYLAAGDRSWWSRALSVARHLGLGHFVSGTWIALLVAALMAAVGVLAVRLTLREL
jgi:hypothetical protein